MRSSLLRGIVLALVPLVVVQAARETIQEAGLFIPAILRVLCAPSRQTTGMLIPPSHVTAIHARELLQYRAYGVGTLMSNYPQDFEVPELRGLPIGLQEYYSLYPGSDGDLLLLVMPISKIFRNALPPNAPNMTMTVADLYGFGTGNLAAGRMRIALFGTLELITDEEESAKCKKAYLEKHGDARGWAGEKGPHSSVWGRLRVEKVYAFDGFGDVAYIGWVPLEMYREATSKMRSQKQVKKDWPVPRQPDDSGLVSARWLFAETDLLMADAARVTTCESLGEDDCERLLLEAKVTGSGEVVEAEPIFTLQL
ncbi:BZ3500_MvSof-1268-A1-R1_Chr7-1g09443 [Microbotryum saponariae]|uniref:BZ3500_MvSof-1268-A1-R1_Chr7-1g09443 protein n=1 Tax=Microbotryum saponariae TaxID=289078 RepID=A0A2X0N223_9BASI|nr:BZ3501_MvSof-1269-A2-R1_Chr7-1g09148 [Microbotryum saponariae]SDA03457.1 BZ3500_MvSof-1268-A1-R1_Chr7-1g09443 [Microbotryum saponariae]